MAMPCPQITVLEETGTEGFDLLIGLDVLDDYGASISLRGWTLTMDQSPTTREETMKPPASSRIVIALSRKSCDDNSETAEPSPSFSSSSGPQLKPRLADAPKVNVADGSGRPSCRGRVRRDDHDLQADLELLEQEASCSHYSSGSDWAEEEVAKATFVPTRLGLGENEDGEEDEDEEDTDEEGECLFDMSGV